MRPIHPPDPPAPTLRRFAATLATLLAALGCCVEPARGDVLGQAQTPVAAVQAAVPDGGGTAAVEPVVVAPAQAVSVTTAAARQGADGTVAVVQSAAEAGATGVARTAAPIRAAAETSIAGARGAVAAVRADPPDGEASTQLRASQATTPRDAIAPGGPGVRRRTREPAAKSRRPEPARAIATRRAKPRKGAPVAGASDCGVAPRGVQPAGGPVTTAPHPETTHRAARRDERPHDASVEPAAPPLVAASDGGASSGSPTALPVFVVAAGRPLALASLPPPPRIPPSAALISLLERPG